MPYFQFLGNFMLTYALTLSTPRDILLGFGTELSKWFLGSTTIKAT